MTQDYYIIDYAADDFLEKNQNETDPYEEKRLKREQRIRDCGKVFHKINASTGQRDHYTSYCKMWRECPTCAEKRKQSLLDEVRSLKNTTRNLVQVEMPEEEFDKVKKGLKAEEYQRYSDTIPSEDLLRPAEDKVYVLMTKETAEETGLEYKEIDEEQIANSAPAYNKRKSGKLLQKIEEENQPLSVELHIIDYVPHRVNIREFTCDNIKEIEPAARMLARERIDYNTNDLREEKDILQYCITVLEQCYLEAAEQYEAEFNFYSSKQIEVLPSSINWDWLKNKVEELILY